MNNENTSIREPEWLYRALRQGKEEAFIHLFRVYYKPLWSYAFRILRDRETANDLVQEVFCKLYEDHASLLITTSLKSYLYRSVYYRSLNHLKHKRVEQSYADGQLFDFYLNHLIQTPDAEIALREEVVNKALESAIHALPARCREIVNLSKNESLSNREIALRMGISVKTVEAQKTIAFSRLRKELEWLFYVMILLA